MNVDNEEVSNIFFRNPHQLPLDEAMLLPPSSASPVNAGQFTLDTFDDTFIDSLRSAASSERLEEDSSASSSFVFDTSSMATTSWGTNITSMFGDNVDRMPHLFGNAAPAPMDADQPRTPHKLRRQIARQLPSQEFLRRTFDDSRQNISPLNARIAASLKNDSPPLQKDRRRTRARRKLARSSSSGIDDDKPRLVNKIRSAPELHVAKKQRSRPSSLKFDGTYNDGTGNFVVDDLPPRMRKQRKRGKQTRSEDSASSEDLAPSSATNSFVVARQPKSKQRKSYKNENRYLSPNPLVVEWAGDGPCPRTSVTAYLCDLSGIPLPDDRQAELAGERTCSLGEDNTTALFSLKMHDTSRGSWVRLRFEIKYLDEPREEWLSTNKFRVDTNIRKNA